MPELSMPRLSRPQLMPRTSQVDEARNAWVEQNPETLRPSPLQAAKNGARKVTDSSRTAWRKTVDVLTPGAPSPPVSARLAGQPVKPPFWKRMFAANEPQPQGPRTVTEWMAQDRLDP
jgi:hypothetical protein